MFTNLDEVLLTNESSSTTVINGGKAGKVQVSISEISDSDYMGNHSGYLFVFKDSNGATFKHWFNFVKEEFNQDATSGASRTHFAPLYQIAKAVDPNFNLETFMGRPPQSVNEGIKAIVKFLRSLTANREVWVRAIVSYTKAKNGSWYLTLRQYCKGLNFESITVPESDSKLEFLATDVTERPESETDTPKATSEPVATSEWN